MKRLDTMQTTGPGTTDTLKLSNFPEGFVCAGILIRISYLLSWGLGSSTPAPGALLASIFGSLTLRVNSGGQEKTPYPTVPGQELRDVARFITRVECPNNLGSLAVTTAGSGTAQIDLFIPFAVEELKDGRTRLPGWTQMRTMTIDLVEGALYNSGGVTHAAGNVSYDIDVLTYPSMLDRASPILGYFRTNQAALFAELPDGVMLGCWEISAAQASTAIALQTLEVGDKKISDNIPPYVAGDKYLLNWDTGVSPITDRVTMGFSPDDGQGSWDLPSGKARYTQAAQYVATLQVRGLAWPPMNVTEANEYAMNAAEKGPVLAMLPPEAASMTDAIARTMPVDFHPAGTPEFTLGHGMMSPGNGAAPYLVVPEATAAIAGAHVDLAGASGPTTMASAQSKQLSTITRQVPGLAQIVHTTKAATVSPEKYATALSAIAGDKGQSALARLKKAVKVF